MVWLPFKWDQGVVVQRNLAQQHLRILKGHQPVDVAVPGLRDAQVSGDAVLFTVPANWQIIKDEDLAGQRVASLQSHLAVLENLLQELGDIGVGKKAAHGFAGQKCHLGGRAIHSHGFEIYIHKDPHLLGISFIAAWAGVNAPETLPLCGQLIKGLQVERIGMGCLH